MTHDEFVSGLRALADYYERHSELPLPDFGISGEVQIFDVNGKDEMAKIAGIFGNCEKEYDWMFRLKKKLGPFTLCAIDYKDQICTKRVVGTRQVEKRVPTEFAMVTETEEIVEWDCGPLLA